MGQRRLIDRERAKALILSGLQIALGLGQTVVLASEDLGVQLAIQAMTHLGGAIARRLWRRRKRRLIENQESHSIEPR